MLWNLLCLKLIGGASGKEPTYQCRNHKRCGFNPYQEDPLEEVMAIQTSIHAWWIRAWWMDREAWKATVYRVAKSQTRIKQLSINSASDNHLIGKMFFASKVFFMSFIYKNWFVSTFIKYISYRQFILVSCIFTQSGNICLLIGMLKTSLFHVIMWYH